MDKLRRAMSGNPAMLAEHIEFLTKMLEPMPLPFVIAHTDGRILACNRAYSRLTGYTREELSKMNRSVLTPPELKAKMDEVERKLTLEGQPVRYKKEYIRKDGSRVPVELYVDFLCDEYGKYLYYYAFVNDLSERKRLEDVMARYRLIFESISDIIFFTYADGKIMEMNDAATRAYGYTHSELLSMNLIDLRTPEERSLARRQLEECCKKGCRYETVHMRKDGKTFPVEVNSRGISINGRRVLIGVIRDITEHKRAEEELEEARDQAEMYIDLISHDINNMNQVSIGYLEMTLSMPDIGDEARQYLSRSLSELNDSSELISAISKVRRTKTEAMRLEPVDLGKMLSEARTQYMHVPGKDVTINFTPASGYTVMANELLRDVFYNLIGNAVKHSGKQVVINIKLYKVMEQGRDFYRVAIDDNGPGISDDIKNTIFRRYKRGKTKARGSGLGLYLVKTLVQGFNGIVRVEDRTPGDYSKGARFVVLLPAA